MSQGAHKGSKHHLARLTEELVTEAREWYYEKPGAISMNELARLYGVADNTMRNALQGVTWKHVPMPKGSHGG